jgi:hypothetical protein
MTTPERTANMKVSADQAILLGLLRDEYTIQRQLRMVDAYGESEEHGYELDLQEHLELVQLAIKAHNQKGEPNDDTR